MSSSDSLTSASVASANPVPPAVRLSFYTEPHRAARWALDPIDAETVLIRRIDHSPSPRYDVDRDVVLAWQDANGAAVVEVGGRIIASTDQGITVRVNPGDRAALARVGVRLPSAAQAPATAVLDAPLRVLRRALQADLLPRIHHLLEHTLHSLGKADLEESSESLGMPMRMAAQRLAACKADVMRAYAARIEHLTLGGGTTMPSGDSALRLVDDEEMQVWLARSEVARSLERQIRTAWHALLPLLKSLNDQSDRLHLDALAVESLLDTLIHACKGTGLEASLQRLLVRRCARSEIIEFGSLYEQLQRDLERLGVRGASDAPARASPPPAAHQAQAVPPPADPPSITPPPEAAQRPAAAPIAAADRAEIMQSARRLISLFAPSAETGLAAATPAADDAPTAPVIADHTLQDLLRTALQTVDAEPAALWSQFGAQLQLHAESSPFGVSAQQASALQMVTRLQDAVEGDPMLPANLRRWSRSLLPTVFGTEMAEGGVSQHSDELKRLFNQLEFAAVLCSERQDPQTAQVLEQIHQVMGGLAEQRALSGAQIEQISDFLEQLTQRQQRAGHASEERVVEACKGQQRLVDARKRVDRELNRLFHNHRLPSSLLHLLEERLKPLMVLLLLRNGPQHESFQNILGGLEQLEETLREIERGESPSLIEGRLAWLEVLFEGHGSEWAAVRPLLDEVGESVRAGPTEWTEYPAAPALQAAEVKAWDEGTDRKRSALRRQLGLLKVGEWISFEAASSAPRLLKLAWHSPERDRFVFVGRLGNKAEDLGVEQLLDVLESGQAQIVEGGESDVLERAWRRMLEGMHNELAEAASHDLLTGTLQRKELERRLSAWLVAPERTQLGLLWIGIDHLRVLNEALGRGAGDSVLSRVGATIRAELERPGMEESYCGRVEGDEFVVVLPDAALSDVQQLGEALLARVTALEHEEGGPSVRVSASIGACLIDESCASMETLLNDAARAYRAAKDEGRGRVYLSQPDDARIRQMRESVEWVGKIEHALEHDALVLFGQRAQSLSPRASEAPDYVEVLLRMRSIEGGYASPEHFIVAAERYGQIHAIDRFVLQRLTRQLSGADRGAQYRIAMNISGRNVVDRAFIDEIIRTWKDADLPQGWLCIELTETAAIQHLAEAAESMARLRDAGVTLVLDDFGSGWSSYQYLRRLPFDIVKVDGAFIKDIATSHQDLLLARSINEIAHMLGKHTVAEHVENAETLELVREIGFDYAQGYVAARPVPLDGLLTQGIGQARRLSAA